MTLLATTAHAILTSAVEAEVGIVVRITAPEPMPSPALRAKQILYRFKKDNALWQNLQIRLSPDDPDNFLWVIKTQGITND